MRRLHFGLLAAGAPLLALCLTLVGCGGGDNKDSTTTDNKTTEPKKAVEWTALEPGKGVLKGTVTLDGPPPDIKKMNDELLANINMNKAKDFCLKGTEEEKEQQAYRIKDGKVANVFVWVEPVDKKNTYFKIDDPKEYAKDLVLHQPHCAFHPHVAVLFPEYHNPKKPSELLPTGQKVTATNDATESHNTNYQGGSKIPGNNKLLQPNDHLDLIVVATTDPITVKCDLHTWMDAYLRAFDHPYATTTKEDGTYEIKNVPTGHKLKIYAWHERADYINPNGKAGQEIEVKDGDNTHDFKLTAPK
jgi:hypothetical protein